MMPIIYLINHSISNLFNEVCNKADYRKLRSGVKSAYGRFLNLNKRFINNIHTTEFNKDITSIRLSPL